MTTNDLMRKRPIEVRYRRRVARRYGDPLPDLAFLTGIATGTVLALELIVH